MKLDNNKLYKRIVDTIQQPIKIVIKAKIPIRHNYYSG